MNWFGPEKRDHTFRGGRREEPMSRKRQTRPAQPSSESLRTLEQMIMAGEPISVDQLAEAFDALVNDGIIVRTRNAAGDIEYKVGRVH